MIQKHLVFCKICMVELKGIVRVCTEIYLGCFYSSSCKLNFGGQGWTYERGNHILKSGKWVIMLDEMLKSGNVR